MVWSACVEGGIRSYSLSGSYDCVYIFHFMIVINLQVAWHSALGIPGCSWIHCPRKPSNNFLWNLHSYKKCDAVEHNKWRRFMFVISSSFSAVVDTPHSALSYPCTQKIFYFCNFSTHCFLGFWFLLNFPNLLLKIWLRPTVCLSVTSLTALSSTRSC